MADVLGSFIQNTDMEALREYVTDKDGHEYDDLAENIVCVLLTHNYMKSKNIELRLDLDSTVLSAKEKIYHFVGTLPEHQALVLKSEEGKVLCELDNNSMLLSHYGIQHGMEIYCVDTNPYSMAKGGGFEDVNLVKKYEISEEAYNDRENTVRRYKEMMKEKKLRELIEKGPPDAGTIAHCHVGNRCEVNPGGRRGEVKWIGIFPGDENLGYWVGIQLDEPVGKSNGTRKGHNLFSCPNNYGTFARGENVTVGDFPDLSFEELEDGNEL